MGSWAQDGSWLLPRTDAWFFFLYSLFIHSEALCLHTDNCFCYLSPKSLGTFLHAGGSFRCSFMLIPQQWPILFPRFAPLWKPLISHSTKYFSWASGGHGSKAAYKWAQTALLSETPRELCPHMSLLEMFYNLNKILLAHWRGAPNLFLILS